VLVPCLCRTQLQRYSNVLLPRNGHGSPTPWQTAGGTQTRFMRGVCRSQQGRAEEGGPRETTEAPHKIYQRPRGPRFSDPWQDASKAQVGSRQAEAACPGAASRKPSACPDDEAASRRLVAAQQLRISVTRGSGGSAHH